jgi:hypothetical protein
MGTFRRSQACGRLATPLFCICLCTLATLCGGRGLAADTDKGPAPSAHGRPFDDVLSSRIITGAQHEPVFIDIDTGYWMTPPKSLAATENTQKSLEEWVFPEALKQWIHHNGIDLAVETDGQSISVVGFDLRVGEELTEFPKSEADVAQKVSAVRPAAANWITFRRSETVSKPGRPAGNPFAKAVPRYGTPFVTREGGLGAFRVSLTDFRGPNSTQFDYQITRRAYVPRLTGQPILAVYEPPILGELGTFLITDVNDQKLCLRTPHSTSQVEVSADEVIVRESHPEIRAARLHTGTLDLDAPAGRVTVNGRGKSATLRRSGDRVQVEFGKQVADSDEIIIWMPELKIPDIRLHWTTAKADPEPKTR